MGAAISGNQDGIEALGVRIVCALWRDIGADDRIDGKNDTIPRRAERVFAEQRARRSVGLLKRQVLLLLVIDVIDPGEAVPGA